MRTLVVLLASIVILWWAAGCSAPEETEAPRGRELVQEVYLVAYQQGFLPKEIAVKALSPVKLFVTSFDEEYHIEIPGLDIGRTPIWPQKETVLSFTPINTGSFEFRNPFLPDMVGTMVVQTCPPDSILRPNPIPTTAASVATGSEVYAAYCVSCHGVSGKGDGPKVGDLYMKPIDLTQPYMAAITDGEMFWVLDQGLGEMPSFKTELSDDLKWHVINYIRSLSQQRSP